MTIPASFYLESEGDTGTVTSVFRGWGRRVPTGAVGGHCLGIETKGATMHRKKDELMTAK